MSGDSVIAVAALIFNIAMLVWMVLLLGKIWFR